MLASSVSPFAVRVDRDSGQTVLCPLGELDVATAHVLVASIMEHKAPGRTIVVDLGSLTFMDAAGARSLVDSTAKAGIEGWTLRIRNVPQGIVRHFGRFGVFGSLHSLS
jgi:anti-anti-sigma factor